MKYYCKLIDDKPRERPICMYTDSWHEAQRWAKLVLEREKADRVEIYENVPVLKESFEREVVKCQLNKT